LLAPHVFPFDHPHALPAPALRALLGGKGAGLAEMTRGLGLRVPPGFTIATTGFHRYRRHGLDALRPELTAALARLESSLGLALGDPSRPLVVSVRSGAAASMPGMLDTLLNLGLNDETCEGLARATSPEFASACYARLIRMFGEIVMGVPRSIFGGDERASAAERVRRFRAAYQTATGEAFPQDPRQQLERAVEAVFRSWDGPRAVAYRAREGIDADLGTAVNVQAMVFGNREGISGTGVGFTRDPATGERIAYGDYLPGAQGEDVVSGTHATLPLSALREIDPGIHAELLATFDRLERHYRDACDVEFTVECGVLWILQARPAKRSAAAAVRIAVDMADDRDFPLTREEALLRVDPEQLRQALSSSRVSGSGAAIARGLPASPGVATGRAFFSADDAIAAADRGEPVILVRRETSPDDVHGMAVAEGIATATGGLASHAAVVARGWGKPAVVGISSLSVERDGAFLAGVAIEPGRVLTIDGGSGELFLDGNERAEDGPRPEVATLLAWAAQVLGPESRQLEPVVQLERARATLGATAREH